jgi:hypothetical protein
MIGTQRIIRKLTVKYLDTSLTLSRQKDKLLVEKVIRKVSMHVIPAYMRGFQMISYRLSLNQKH